MEQTSILNRYSLVFYWIVPILMGIIQASFNLYFEILPWGISLVDGSVYGFSAGNFRYGHLVCRQVQQSGEKSFAQLLTSHLSAAIILSLAWVYSAAFITRTLLPDPKYLAYQENQLSTGSLLGSFSTP